MKIRCGCGCKLLQWGDSHVLRGQVTVFLFPLAHIDRLLARFDTVSTPCYSVLYPLWGDGDAAAYCESVPEAERWDKIEQWGDDVRSAWHVSGQNWR